MQDSIHQYIKKAQAVLDKNWRRSYTIPSSSLPRFHAQLDVRYDN